VEQVDQGRVIILQIGQCRVVVPDVRVDLGRRRRGAVEKGSYRVRIGGDARMLGRLSRLMPHRATALVANKMKALLDI
jgi:hypothetical protein